MTANNANKNVQAFSMDDFASALEGHDYGFAVGQIVSGKIIAHESTGIYVDIGAKSLGFLPSEEFFYSNITEKLPLGSEHQFVITSEQNADGEVKLSIRRMLEKLAWQKVEEVAEKNGVVNCRVINFNNGGLVVNFDGLRGFVPRSQLAERTEDLSVYIKRVLPLVIIEGSEETGKLVMSHRKAVKQSAFSQLSKGQLITGIVSGLRPFGAFVSFDGITGLLHNKEISQKTANAEGFFAIGESVTAVITDIDESRGRVALSTKFFEMHPGEFLENRALVTSQAEERLEKNISKLWNA